jgi:2-alkenal reductase
MRLNGERSVGFLVVMLLCIAFVIGGMWGGLVGGGLVLWVLGPDDEATQQAQVVSPTPTATASPTTPLLPSPTPSPVLLPTSTPSLEDAIEAVLPSVVTIINLQAEIGFSQNDVARRVVGSGIVVGEEGFIVTNAHVIAEAGTLTVILAGGQEVPASIVTKHNDLDLALLRIASDLLPPATWGDSSEVRLGQSVVAIGSTLGDFPNSVTMGVVSGLNRALALDGYVVYGLIQTDAAINQGNSGGPLINLEGEVIGINTFMIREDHNQGMAQGIGFAIPASSVKALVGTWIVEATGQTPESLNVEEGAVQPAQSPPGQ